MLLDEVWFTQLEMLLRGIMPNEDRMTVDERRKYLKLVSPRYAKAGRVERSGLPTAQQLAQWEEVVLTPDLAEQLGTISRATVQRLLQRFQQDRPKLPRRKSQPPNRLLREVPMERLGWAIASPGSFEADLVHHCGQVAAGEYVHTLQLVDIATGWSERVAVFGRSQAAMVAGFQHVQTRLPFPISQLHPDNGSEFFNDHLIRYFGEEMTGLRLSRSRPYRKNDNRFVEQKNATLVRAYTGYDRLDRVGGSVLPSMPSMTNCGCTTTCSSRCCTWWARK